jgi:hypothetical protein
MIWANHVQFSSGRLASLYGLYGSERSGFAGLPMPPVQDLSELQAGAARRGPSSHAGAVDYTLRVESRMK